MTRKTLLVGWDAACWEYLTPLLERDELPNLQRLIDSGFRGSLQSTIPPMTPAAWSSIITGKLPRKHGIYGWVGLSGYRAKVPRSSDVIGTPFWRRLNAQGIRVGLVNIPLTYPPTPIDGFIVCGFGAPGETAGITYPRSLLVEIETELEEFQPNPGPDYFHEIRRSKGGQALYEAKARMQAMHVQAALYAASKYEVDVLAINLMLFDHMNHEAADFGLVEAALREMDRQLSLLLSGFVPDDVMLFSDHGARRLKGFLLLGDWLAERGYLIRRRKSEQTVSELNFLLLQYLTQGLRINGRKEKLLRAVLGGIVPHLPGDVGDVFWRDVKSRVPRAFDHYWFDPVDTDADTSPILHAAPAGTIYFNRSSSSLWRHVTVDQMAAALVEELETIRDPETDQPLFRMVLGREELYGSHPAGSPPDLFVDFYGSEFGLRTRMGAGLQLRYPHFAYRADNPTLRNYGWHTHQGAYVFSGSRFRNGVSPDVGHVVDIPAVLLHLYRVPVPADFDGKVLTATLAHEYPVLVQPGDVVSQQGVQGGEFDKEEEEQLLSHLRALGYLD